MVADLGQSWGLQGWHLSLSQHALKAGRVIGNAEGDPMGGRGVCHSRLLCS